MQKLLPKSLFLKRSKIQQPAAFLFLNSPLKAPTVHKGFPWFPVVLYLLKLCAQSSRVAPSSEVFFSFYLIACLYKHDVIQETFQMKGKGTKFYLLNVLLHGSCTYFFFKHKRLQPFKLQNNCHPSKRDWFIFLKLKIMFTNGNNCRAPFSKFQNQTTSQAEEFKNTSLNPRLLVLKLNQASKMTYLGVHGIRSKE